MEPEEQKIREARDIQQIQEAAAIASQSNLVSNNGSTNQYKNVNESITNQIINPDSGKKSSQHQLSVGS